MARDLANVLSHLDEVSRARVTRVRWVRVVPRRLLPPRLRSRRALILAAVALVALAGAMWIAARWKARPLMPRARGPACQWPPLGSGAGASRTSRPSEAAWFSTAIAQMLTTELASAQAAHHPG